MTAPAGFVTRTTRPASAPLVPEVRLHLARASRLIFEQAAAFTGDGGRWPPYWAFAWPGGQGLARYMLDNPACVAGRRIVDVGAGSGLGAIAAMLAGAATAAAIDPDPLACEAVRLNARLNAVALRIVNADPLGEDVQADVILIGDLVYEPELETRVTAFLEGARRTGADILFGDRSTARRPPVAMTQLAQFEAPLAPPLEDGYLEHARVWLVDRAGRRAR